MEERVSFREYMTEQKLVNRWFVVMIGVVGGFCGALLTLGFMLVLGYFAIM